MKFSSSLFIRSVFFIGMYLISDHGYSKTPISSQIKLPKKLEQAHSLMNSNDCKSAWELLWSLGKKRNYDALFALVEMILIGGMNPPGLGGHQPPSEAEQQRLATLLIYATLSHWQFAKGHDPFHTALPKAMPTVIKALNLGEPGNQVAECYNSNKDNRTCVNLAQSLGLIPTLVSFGREYDSTIQINNWEASCRPSPLTGPTEPPPDSPR